MKPTTLIISLALIGMLTAPAVSAAEEPTEVDEEELGEEVDPGDIERAQEFFDAGAQAYYRGDYDQAAVEFRRAHEAHPHPMFLYNFALANKQLGRLDTAVDAAEAAAEMDGALPPEQDARNNAIITAGTTVYGGEELAEELESLLGEPVAEEEEDDEEEIADIDAPPEPADASWGLVGWAGVGAIGAGAAGLVLGGVAHADVSPYRSEFEERQQRNPESTALEDFESEITARETTRNMLFISGGALMAVGAGLVVWESMTGPDTDAEPAAMQWNIHPGGAGVTLQW